jgi:formylglycine-generating enzyme required for sulfatase activity
MAAKKTAKANKIIIAGNDTAQADIVVPTLAGNVNGPIVPQSTKGRTYDLPEYDIPAGSGLVVVFKADWEECPFEDGNPMWETPSVKDDAGGHVFRPIWREHRVEKTEDASQVAYQITRLREEVLDSKKGGLYAYTTYTGEVAPTLVEMSVCGTSQGDGLPLRFIHEIPSTKRPGQYATRLMMCLVEMGAFMYGSQKESVHLNTFYSTMSPITVEQFGAFAADADYSTTPSGDNGATWMDPKFDDGYKQGPDHPVVFVNYFDAEAFAHWAGIRIPTEQEVEKSVRGTDGRTYPWGEAQPNEELLQWSGPDEKGVKRQKLGTSSVYAHPKGRSPFGILDAAGNVWVWTSSQ